MLHAAFRQHCGRLVLVTMLLFASTITTAAQTTTTPGASSDDLKTFLEQTTVAGLPCWALLLIILGFILIMTMIAVATERTDKRAASKIVLSQRARDADARQVKTALELWLETDSFCDEARRAAATQDLEKTLAAAPATIAAEAERQRTAKESLNNYSDRAAEWPRCGISAGLT